MHLRPTARVLVVDSQQRLLLFHIHDGVPLHAAYPTMAVYWITPGGGLEPNETFEQAARRELWEETGIPVDALGPCVWHHERVVNLSAGPTLLREHVFVAHVGVPQVQLTNLLPHEQRTHRAYRWWSLVELEQSTESFLPVGLARLLTPILAGDMPAEPLQIGS